MDVGQLKDKISNNEEYISTLLECADFLNIRKNGGNEFRCQWGEGHTNGGIQVKIDSLKANAYSMNLSGDIVTLLQNKLNIKFRDTLNWICKTLKFDSSSFVEKQVTLPFGGYYRERNKEIKREIYGDIDYKTYPESILSEFGNTPCMRFYKDDISFQTQEKYNVGYDVLSNRITVPWRNLDGEIIGIMGRINADDYGDMAKWFPVISFPKNGAIFGLYENYNSIIQRECCFIGESEKTSLVLDSFDMPVGLGLGGNVISECKANLIKSTRAKTIILVLDEGLAEEVSINNAKMIKSNNGCYSNKVGYIYDKENKYIPQGSKASPYDFGKEVFEKLIKECIIWV